MVGSWWECGNFTECAVMTVKAGWVVVAWPWAPGIQMLWKMCRVGRRAEKLPSRLVACIRRDNERGYVLHGPVHIVSA